MFAKKFDYSKLRGKIREKFGSELKFAKALGMGNVSLNRRLNNSIEFSQSEMERISELLEVPKSEIPVYFFTYSVQKHELSVT